MAENSIDARNPTVSQLIDEYMAAYDGRDLARVYRLATWKARLGAKEALGLTDDDVFFVLETIASEPARVYAGNDADGHPIYRLRKTSAGHNLRRSEATVNRYHANLAAVFSWAIKKRRVPKGWQNPCRNLSRRRENPGIVRFLSPDERDRLLAACRAASWPRLYLLVLMALTTGARRSELLNLRWCDIEQLHAYVRTTKNGEPKLLPLVPMVAEQLAIFHAADLEQFKTATLTQLVFRSRIKPDVAYNFEASWRLALKTAHIHQFRFHDLRHTTASYLAQRGASLLEIADVMGHRQLAMVRRYAHLTIDSKVALINRVLGDIK